MNGKEMLKRIGLAGGGLLALYGGIDIARNGIRVNSAGNPTTPTPAVEPKGNVLAPTATLVPRVENPVTATVTPRATEVAGGAELTGGQFTVSGLPEKVDPKNVLVAKGPDGYGNNFVNTGFAPEVFAEPGVFKVGPEFSQAEFDKLGKSVERYNPANQAVISTQEGFWSVREGGFTVLNGNNMKIEVAGNDSEKPFSASFGGDESSHTIVVIRGLFPDKTTPKDRNRTVKITNHPAGHTLVDSYPLGAYISEGHVKQMIENAHQSYPNSGDAGSPWVRIFTLDLNTGAWAYYIQLGVNGLVVPMGSNFK